MQVIDKTASERRRIQTRDVLISAGEQLVDWLLAVPLVVVLSVLYGEEFGLWAGIALYVGLTVGATVVTLLGDLWALRRDAVQAERAGLELPASDHIGGGSR